MPSLNIKDYILVALGLVIVVLLWQINSKVEALEEMTADRDKKVLELALSKVNIENLENQIAETNAQIEAERIDVEAKQKAFDEAMKPDVVTKYVKVYIKDVDDNKTECENINSILSNIRINGL